MYQYGVGIWWRCPVAVPGVRLADRAAALHTDRGTPSCPAASAPGSAGQLGPDSHLRFESHRHSK